MTTVDLEQQRLLIGGEWVEASGGGTFERTDPFTGDAVTVAAAAGREDARRAVEAARDAFPEWSGTSPGERRKLLSRAADLLMEAAPDIAATMTEEVGGTFGWGMFNCDLASRMLREAAAQTYSVVGEVIPSDVPGSLAMGVRQPAGVVVGMTPWNAPVILGTRAIATPLAYGNTVVLKASEQCPRTHAAIARALVDAGLPAGAVEPDHPFRRGRARRGRRADRASGGAAGELHRLLEGRPDRRDQVRARTSSAACSSWAARRRWSCSATPTSTRPPNAASFGAFMNSGQICMSTERIVADRSVAGELGSKLAERAGRLVTGDPRDQGTMIGPVVNDGARERIMELIEDARAKGAEVLSGGEADGNLITPTVLAGVTPEMRIYGEESFGPVVSIVPVDGPEEAVRVANDTEYGLSAAVFGADVDAAMAVARQIESGICHVNSSTVHDEPQMPFGGVKASGWGRFGGRAALEEFTELRWMTVQEGVRHYPI